jgi:UDP-glucose 4-epimerase
LIRAISVVAGHEIEPELGPPRTGDIQHSQADVSLAWQKLGFAAKVSLNDGIARVFDSFR